ncbi:TauD/TfdA family dioxygenase [Dermatobacter hominis]|uniref:TauD/TfdA family dioxygenase n=1 Tax=Dermatobacter hominis TaxID=2884263 RepID=UPI001D10847E|nr:TauD/TfdA family dioxygenase [Dermatobacter hominis]UDY35257.1 TauD/TfdA family dioxygenase [Dermatobacter hominis]
MVVSVSWEPGCALPQPPDAEVGAERFVGAAGRAGRSLPPAVFDALVALQDAPPRDGALLVRGVPVGDLPATPAHPADPVDKDRTSELALLAVARRLGQPVGYLPEHGGDLVQNLVPTVAGADRQVSTSSRVDLAFHTETAFHPHAPRYLVLLCLRGHPDARTTLCSVHDVIDALDADTVAVLRQARFVCGVDESFLSGPRPSGADDGAVLVATSEHGPRAVIGGTEARPTFWYDAELMRGNDPAAQAALDQLGRAVAERLVSVVLEAGDCLVVDNTVAVHGRSSYAARFDGTDRWLQRAFVVADLAPSAPDRDGRIILTRFD